VILKKIVTILNFNSLTLKPSNPQTLKHDIPPPTPYTLHPKQGFTLIEILVATSILGIIGLIILTTFASGLKVYERVQTFGGAQADILLALEEIEQNLRNVFPMSSIAFVGGTQSISFPTMVTKFEMMDGEEKVLSSIGKISYSFDSVNKELVRLEQDYSQAVAEGGGSENQTYMAGFIEDIKFSFYSYNDENETYGWKNSWGAEEKNILLGVKIELAYQRESQNIKLTRTVFLPTNLGIENEIVEEGEEEGEGEGEEQGEV